MVGLFLRCCGRERKRERPGGLGFGVELGGVAVLDGDTQGLLQEAAGLAALGAGVALGLHSGLALGRDGDLDDALRHGSPALGLVRATR
jgi:hypothetical protein